jgi:hypothetical protein
VRCASIGEGCHGGSLQAHTTMKSLLSLWRARQNKLPDNEIRELTAQFYVTLEAYFAKIKSAGSPRCPDAYARVEELLGSDARRNWTNAYAIEQLLVHLFDDGTLANELQVRVREAKETLRPALTDHYRAEADKTTLSADERRALLSRLVNDLQWRYTVNEVKRGYTKEITLNTGQLFILSLLVFAIAVLLTLGFPDLKQLNLLLLVPAVLAGCWGASFSMLSSLRERLDASELDALKVLRARSVLGSRVLIGAGAASILYFFFVSGLVTGSAFPDLKPTEALTTPPHKWLETFALLVVWCFVGGFSERLIPGLLARTEGRLEAASSPDRYRPASADSDGASAARAQTAAQAETKRGDPSSRKGRASAASETGSKSSATGPATSATSLATS